MSSADPSQVVIRSLENIGKLLFETQSVWAQALGVSVPQWLILVAIQELDEGNGVSVADVARRVRVDPSFVTAQTKLLEKAGYVVRKQSAEDGRVVLMFLADRTATALSAIDARRKAFNTFIFSDFTSKDIQALATAFVLLEKRFTKAPHLLALDN
ncbi:MarR family transcriptional regulator [Tardiphaga alba]|uniref:MarR family transcriptional regulator n=1 Tax=Tardiphaga alba TaxID=340268 RepID=A0ABX8A4A7_9BRAD|nr:MarR family transcriptional regulator [Tardiphaga alba]QUS37811.1 MarR family transcriptional regulator [Tardiphaga alba]